MLLRGENRRMAELADLSLLKLGDSEGPTPCHALVLQIQNGKTNKHGKKQFMGAVRHKDPMKCTMGALAQYLFWRWHVSGEEAPVFRHRKDWYNIKILKGEDKAKELAYVT